MTVRKLTGEEKFEAEKFSLIAFHVRKSDLSKTHEECLKDPADIWGAFTEEGELAGRMGKPVYTVNVNGHLLPMSGISGVATLPEYREGGAIRSIFSALLPEAYQNGEVLSGLFPFNHAFYRKAGYEVMCYRNDYTIPTPVLRPYRFTGKAARWLPGKPIDGYQEVYRAFSASLNLTAARSGEVWKEQYVTGDNVADGKFCYLLSEGDSPVAYVIYQDEHGGEGALLKIEDCAWKNAAGFRALLGFLGRFTADYTKILLPLPCGIELHNLIRSPDAYDIEKTTRQDFMIRAVNAEKLLAALTLPRGASFVIRIGEDELIPANNGIWSVSERGVFRTEEAPDLTVSARAFGQLAVGAVDLDEALLRGDTVLSPAADAALLSQVFSRKKILITEHF